jgi:hypothetical protein
MPLLSKRQHRVRLAPIWESLRVRLKGRWYKKAYQYDEADVGKIVRALTKEVDTLRARMTHTSSKDTIDFSL